MRRLQQLGAARTAEPLLQPPEGLHQVTSAPASPASTLCRWVWGRPWQPGRRARALGMLDLHGWLLGGRWRPLRAPTRPASLCTGGCSRQEAASGTRVTNCLPPPPAADGRAGAQLHERTLRIAECHNAHHTLCRPLIPPLSQAAAAWRRNLARRPAGCSLRRT